MEHQRSAGGYRDRVSERRAGLPRGAVTLLVVIGAVLTAGVVAAAAHEPGHRATPVVVELASPTPPGTTPSGAAPLKWSACGAAQCARLEVPLDWTGRDPRARGLRIALAMLRYPATGSAADRIGSLVVNPGGPGASGVDFVRDNVSIIPAAIRARFDIVGFDPRGTGASMPVHCLSGPQLDQLFALPPYPDSPAEEQQLVAGSRLEADACATALGPALPHLATVDVARDLDAIRAALGDSKLSYLGYSYGTYIGAAYAQAFPTHIRAMVLDGAINPDLDGAALISEQADGFETAFNAFSAWCAGNPNCMFGRNLTSVSQLQASYDLLAASVRRNPLVVGTRRVTSGEFYLGVLVTLYSKDAGWPALGIALATAQQGNGTVLLELADQYVDRGANGQYSPEDEANLAVNCIDHPWPTTPAAYAALADQLARRDPRFGRAIAWSGLGCAFWRAAPVTAPHEVHAPGAPTILVVGTTRDPATPYDEAVSLADQLDQGVLVTNVGDGHTAYRSTGSGCVQDVVDRYLITLAAPPRAGGVRCG